MGIFSHAKDPDLFSVLHILPFTQLLDHHGIKEHLARFRIRVIPVETLCDQSLDL